MFRQDLLGPTPADQRSGPRILVLGEHRAVREALASALRAAGFDPTDLALPSATGGRQHRLQLHLDRVQPVAGLLVARLDHAQHVRSVVGVVRDVAVPWVVVSESGPGPGWGAALDAGARDVCSTSVDLPALVELLRGHVASGYLPGADPLRAGALDMWSRASRRLRASARRMATLSGREMDLLVKLDQGESIGTIAAHAGLSDTAVESVVSSILDKLDVGSRRQALGCLRELNEWFHA